MIILLYIQAHGGEKQKKRAIKRIRVYYINKWGEKNIYYWYKAKEKDIYLCIFARDYSFIK